MGQWAFVECSPAVRRAGEEIIKYIRSRRISSDRFRTVQKDSKNPISLPDLQEALQWVQTLEPSGVGARNLQECLVIQLEALKQDRESSEGHDFDWSGP